MLNLVLYILFLIKFIRISKGEWIILTDFDMYDRVNLSRHGITVNVSYEDFGIYNVVKTYNEHELMYVNLKNRVVSDIIKRYSFKDGRLVAEIIPPQTIQVYLSEIKFVLSFFLYHLFSRRNYFVILSKEFHY